jgi:hypothetical protein
MQEFEPNVERPIPGLARQPITVYELEAFAPEKMELLEGYLFDGPDYPEQRRNLLTLLLVNEGLIEAVRLAPAEQWRVALRQVYGEP